MKIIIPEVKPTELGERQEIPFMVESEDFKLTISEIVSTYPDTKVVAELPVTLEPHSSTEFKLMYTPGKKTLEMALKKEKRQGEIIVKGTELIE